VEKIEISIYLLGEHGKNEDLFDSTEDWWEIFIGSSFWTNQRTESILS